MRRLLPLPALIALAVAAAPAAEARTVHRTPSLTGVRCVPAGSSACHRSVRVRTGRQVQLRGTRFYAGMRVTFRWSRGALATALHRSRAGWVARVPAGTAPGRVSVTVRDRAGRRSNARRITVLAPPTPAPIPGAAIDAGPGRLPAAFAGSGMWIWQLDKSDGGNLDTIAARAKAAGIGTVFVKAGDGTTAWAQFSDLLVAGLHARGLRACAWQYVYGDSPEAEAQVAAQAIGRGADCFAIDAEKEYEGRYAAAQRYVTALRAAVGAAYPVGFTSFPYVDYHPGLPFSVFLGPGAAQANLPQVYWKTIGGGVDAVSAHAFAHNRIYPAAIAPLGQSYDNPPAADMQRFRAIWTTYGAGGLSWWSWQASSPDGWNALAQPAPGPAPVADPGFPTLGKGAKGDEVIWLQEHLTSTYPAVRVTGTLDSATVAALQDLQTRNGIPVTGTTDPATWQRALALALTPVDWTAAPATTARAARTASDRRREMPGGVGRGPRG